MQAKYPVKVRTIRSKGRTDLPGSRQVGGRDYATGEEKGEKEIAYLCQPGFFYAGVFQRNQSFRCDPLFFQKVDKLHFPIFIINVSLGGRYVQGVN